MTWLTTKITGWLAGAGVALALLLGIYAKGRSDSAARTEAERAAERAKSLKQAREVEDEVSRLDPGGVDRRLSDWMRD
jgi:hypothetical protein